LRYLDIDATLNGGAGSVIVLALLVSNAYELLTWDNAIVVLDVGGYFEIPCPSWSN